MSCLSEQTPSRRDPVSAPAGAQGPRKCSEGWGWEECGDEPREDNRLQRRRGKNGGKGPMPQACPHRDGLGLPGNADLVPAPLGLLPPSSQAQHPLDKSPGGDRAISLPHCRSVTRVRLGITV